MKYPRTYHLPWSPGATKDDKKIDSVDHLLNKNIVITEKIDGECTSLYRDKIHARSEDSGHHESRAWIKNFWGRIQHLIPENVQIVGENVYAKHSIFYDKLRSYFYGFMVIEDTMVLSWPDTLKLFDDVGILPAPTICFGPLHKNFIRQRLVVPTYTSELGDTIEGYVLRPLESFDISTFDRNVLKYVREGHVQTDKHWSKEWVKNELKY